MPARTWNLDLVNARQAHNALLRRRHTAAGHVDWGSVEIAHLDTGFTRHGVFGPWAPDGSNAILLTRQGVNFVENVGLPEDPLDYYGFPGHGTRTLSVLCGDLPGTFRGVAPGAPTVPYRVTNTVIILAASTRRRIAAAIDHAVTVNACEVVSISLGTPILSLFERRRMGEAVDRAYENGVIVVAAGGQVIDRTTYPGKFFRTIGVGGVTPERTPWFEYEADDVNEEPGFIDVWAPADDILRANTVLRNGVPVEAPYETGDGTSYAAVHVAAAAAMWLAYHGDDLDREYDQPWQRVEAFRTLLETTHLTMAGSYRPRQGTGILDIAALLSAALPKKNRLKFEAREAAGQAF